MSTAETHDIRIEIEGVVRLLSANLYASPDAFVREMIQNAHDAIQRRAAREPLEPYVRILPDAARRTIVFEDNGLGLTRDDVTEYLSTIGRSGTRAFKEQLSARSPSQAAALIGQFGIGLLSAFMVAERVEVETRHPDDAHGWRWAFDGGSTYSLSPSDRAAVGTRATLHLSEAATGYLATDRLEALVHRYADFVRVPIFVGLAAHPTNAVVAPWDHADGATEERVRSLLSRRFPREELLSIFSVDASLASAPGARLAGAFAIRGSDATVVPPRVDLYVRRMFITSELNDLLPPWARLVSGVVECDGLTPTASRDRVLADEVLTEVKAILEAAVIDHLRMLARERPRDLVGLLRLHSHSLLALLATTAEAPLFDALAEHVPLKQLAGPPAPLPELVRANTDGPRLRYAERRETARQLLPLCRARGLVVVDVEQPYAKRFLLRFARERPSELEPLAIDRAGAGGLIEPLEPEASMRFRALETAAARSVAPDRVSVARFGVPGLDAVYLETARGAGLRQQREVVEELGTPDFIAAALAGVGEPTAGEAVLHLNADSPVVAALAARNRLGETPDRDVLGALVDQAILLSGRAGAEADTEARRERAQRLWLRLLDAGEEGSAG